MQKIPVRVFPVTLSVIWHSFITVSWWDYLENTKI
jgi:hypothetical protein